MTSNSLNENELEVQMRKQITELEKSNQELSAEVCKYKREEETLKKNEKLLQAIIDGSSGIIFAKDLEGRFIFINKRLEELLGITLNEIKGKTDYDIFPPELAEYYQRHDSAVLETGVPEQLEETSDLVDGQHVFLSNKFPIYNSQGKPYAVCGISTDITERKKAEKALKRAHENLEKKIKERTAELEKAYNSLKESEKSLAEAQKLAQVGSYDWNIITNEEYWSDELYNIFGVYPQHELDHNLFLKLIHPEDLAYVNRAINEAINGKPYHIDYRIILPDGKERVIYSQGGVIFDEKNTPVKMRGIVQDITERKKADVKLKESEEKYRNIVETANEGILIINDKAIITFANQKITDMLGYTQEEGIGKAIWDFIDEESKHIVKLNLENRQHNINQSYELRLINKDGLPLWVTINAKALFNDNGKFIGSLSMVTDISKRKEAEETLAKIEETRIKEIHHRIKNNLQVISSLLSLEAEKFREKDIIESFKESQNRIASMALIHEELYKGNDIDTLDFAAYLKKLTTDMLESYYIGSDKISLKLDLEQANFDMDTAIPLGIIVNELFSNSLKHAFPDERKGEIHIALKRAENFTVYENECKGQGNYRYVLMVADNGTGFSEEIDIQNTDSLGIQLVNVLVEQIDGCIEFKKGYGTSFTIWFNNTG